MDEDGRAAGTHACSVCSRSICDRQTVISRVLGAQERLKCLDCLSAELGSESPQICQLIGNYLVHRECYRKEWLSARPCGQDGQSPCCPSRLEKSERPPRWYRAELFSTPEVPEADERVDAEESGCGDLMVLLMRSIRKLQPGQVLELIARDPGAAADIPAWCRLTGHPLLAGPTGPDEATYFIRRKED